MPRKIVLAGGSGQLGRALQRHFEARGDTVCVLTRSPRREGDVAWDGRRLGDWTALVDGCDVVVNLAGRTVNCRYTAENMRQMMDSRVDSTRVVGEAIAAAGHPPPVWLQMSTATIYAHRFDAANDDETGTLGGDEADVPSYWAYSVEIARRWEATLDAAPAPRTRKVALRASMVMGPAAGGVFDVLARMCRLRIGGPVGGGAQFVSWIHERDFVGAVEFLIEHDELDGPIIVAAPNPLPQRAFMAALREALGVRVGLPATKWMAEVGAWVLRTDTELLLKSRRVVPSRLLAAGYDFELPTWPEAAAALVASRRREA